MRFRTVRKIGKTEILTPQKKGKTILGEKNTHANSLEMFVNRSQYESFEKRDHQLKRNYYGNLKVDNKNLSLLAATYNLRVMMRMRTEEIKYFL